jgi:hypothetical protein
LRVLRALLDPGLLAPWRHLVAATLTLLGPGHARLWLASRLALLDAGLRGACLALALALPGLLGAALLALLRSRLRLALPGAALVIFALALPLARGLSGLALPLAGLLGVALLPLPGSRLLTLLGLALTRAAVLAFALALALSGLLAGLTLTDARLVLALPLAGAGLAFARLRARAALRGRRGRVALRPARRLLGDRGGTNGQNDGRDADQKLSFDTLHGGTLDWVMGVDGTADAHEGS